MRIKELRNKRILILGFGREGQDTYGALKKLFPEKRLGIGDKDKSIKPCLPAGRYKVSSIKKAELYLGADYLEAVKDYDVIIRSPGIQRCKVKKRLQKGQVLTSQAQIFFDNCPGTIIGVTGTKGKGTTSTLIYKILKQAGLQVCLVGNIGKPVFQVLLRTMKDRPCLQRHPVFVYELSSHQLDGLKASPHIAVFLNLFPDHLDYFNGFDAYKKAKENILWRQTDKDFVVYNTDDERVKEIVERIVKKTGAQKIAFSLFKEITTFGGSPPAACLLARQGRQAPKCCYESCLIGDFNKLNVAAAVAVARIMKLPEEAIKQAVQGFRGLPHRLEFVGKYQAVKFYNDSMATIPEAAIAALNAFQGKVETLIVGGSDKGCDYQKLAEAILKQRVGNLIILGQGTGEEIWRNIVNIDASDLPVCYQARSMDEAVRIAFQKTNRGVCLLSPASASFNLFSGYKERGDLFKQAIKKYASQEKKTKN